MFQRTNEAHGHRVPLTASRRILVPKDKTGPRPHGPYGLQAQSLYMGISGGGGSSSGGKGVGSLRGLPSEWKNAICVLDTRIHIHVRPHPDPDPDPRSRTHYSKLRTAKELQSVTESSEA